MPLFRPSELQEYLQKLGSNPKRTLSQNFLIDGNILNKIVQASNAKAGDLVVEIGPGPGALTEKLLEAGCKVLAIEMDAAFAKALQGSHESLEVACADVLEYPLREELQKRLPTGAKAKVVANLPYHLTTPIIQKLVELEDLVESCTLMVQEEVARKLVAPKTSRDFVAFTLFLHFFSHPHYCFKVSPNCFYPAPKVHSAVIRLDFERRYPLEDVKAFFTLVNTAFAERRKMLQKTLRAYFEPVQIENALVAIQKSPNARPEELSIQDWVSFFIQLNG